MIAQCKDVDRGKAPPHLASIVLNYKSEHDTQEAVHCLVQQQGVCHDIIVVDNASPDGSGQRILDWLNARFPSLLHESQRTAQPATCPHTRGAKTRIFHVQAGRNAGYSAGNNVGLRLACALGAEAALVMNPDVRISNTHYLLGLFEALAAAPNAMIAASRILNLDGDDQNPFREPTFTEELLWPFSSLLNKARGTPSFRLRISDMQPSSVPKVAGCCFLARASFLQDISYLDEATFLYCEEAILAAQIQQLNGTILFVPSLSAVHAHVATTKGNTATRAAEFVRSRMYYLTVYKKYSLVQIKLLRASYAALTLLTQFRTFLNRSA